MPRIHWVASTGTDSKTVCKKNGCGLFSLNKKGKKKEHNFFFFEEMAGECISYEVAVGQLLANDFAGVEERLRVNVRTSPIHALLFAQIAFARAVLSLSPADAEDALARCWDADALANEAGEGGGRGGMMYALF